MTEIKKCTCKSEYQDKLYGAGMRLFNFAPKHGWRCTVCGRVIPFNKTTKPTDEK